MNRRRHLIRSYLVTWFSFLLSASSLASSLLHLSLSYFLLPFSSYLPSRPVSALYVPLDWVNLYSPRHISSPYISPFSHYLRIFFPFLLLSLSTYLPSRLLLPAFYVPSIWLPCFHLSTSSALAFLLPFPLLFVSSFPFFSCSPSPPCNTQFLRAEEWSEGLHAPPSPPPPPPRPPPHQLQVNPLHCKTKKGLD